jgi:hypothetical protein
MAYNTLGAMGADVAAAIREQNPGAANPLAVQDFGDAIRAIEGAPHGKYYFPPISCTGAPQVITSRSMVPLVFSGAGTIDVTFFAIVSNSYMLTASTLDLKQNYYGYAKDFPAWYAANHPGTITARVPGNDGGEITTYECGFTVSENNILIDCSAFAPIAGTVIWTVGSSSSTSACMVSFDLGVNIACSSSSILAAIKNTGALSDPGVSSETHAGTWYNPAQPTLNVLTTPRPLYAYSESSITTSYIFHAINIYGAANAAPTTFVTTYTIGFSAGLLGLAVNIV